MLLATTLFANEFAHHGFTVKCAKCEKIYETNKHLQKQVAWRTHIYKREDGKLYAKYRCYGGHEYWAEIK